MPRSATPSAASGTAAQKPTKGESHTATYMPSMNSEPWAKLTMRVTPKMSDSPAARRNSELAPASPFRNCSRTAEPLTGLLLLRAQLADFLVSGLELRPVGVAPVDHHAPAVFLRKLADIGAHGRLVVDAAPHDRPERRLHLEPLQRLDELFR